MKIAGIRYSRDNWFTCVDTVVLADKELSCTAKCILAILCMTAGFGHRSCSLSDEEAADIAGISIRTLHRAYRELEARGIIFRDDNMIHIIGYNAPCYDEEV